MMEMDFCRYMAAREPETLGKVIDAYEEIHATGGSLHIVLEDGNWERHHIEWCAKYAAEHGDFIGEGIAKTLLKIPDDILALAKDASGSVFDAIFDAWSRRLLAEQYKARGIAYLVNVYVGGSFGIESWPSCVAEYATREEALRDVEERLAVKSDIPHRHYRFDVVEIGDPEKVVESFKKAAI